MAAAATLPSTHHHKWSESSDRLSYRETKDTRDWRERERDARERERDKRREKKKEKRKVEMGVEEEDQKKLDLDTRYLYHTKKTLK